MRSPQEEAAHRYADHGWFVFPTAPGSKIPTTEHGFLDATTHHKQIQQWWRAEPRANVAVATGHPGRMSSTSTSTATAAATRHGTSLRQAGLASGPQAVDPHAVRRDARLLQGHAAAQRHLPEHAIDFRSPAATSSPRPARTPAAGRTPW